MNTPASLQKLFAPLFPGLMGIELAEVTADRVVASLEVRPDLCTTGEVLNGGALMALADTLGAVGTFVTLPAGARVASGAPPALQTRPARPNLRRGTANRPSRS